MQLRSGRQIPSGAQPEPTIPKQNEKIYDYIVKRNRIITVIKTLLHQIENEPIVTKQVELIHGVFREVDQHMQFLSRYTFEPNQRFFRTFYDLSIALVEFLEMYELDFDQDLFYRVMDEVGSKIHK